MHEPLRLAAATAGITFAVILMLMQLGFEDALLSSAGLHFSHMSCDLALVSPQYEFLLAGKGFPERRLYQCLAIDGVKSVEPVYCGQGPWTNPWTHKERNIFMVGFNPRPGYLDWSGVDDHLDILRRGDNVLFDSLARPEFGPVGRALSSGRRVHTQIAGRQVDVAGMFRMGTSFAIDGTVVMSDSTFFRLLPYRKPGVVTVGLIKLRPGVDSAQTRARLNAALPADVLVLTHEGLVNLERNYWATNTPVGFIFRIGLLMGLFVGSIIVYQILFTDVSDHLAEYATLKAMGHHDGYLFSVVIQESLILSVFGFFPGTALSMLLYRIAGDATLLPLRMTCLRAGVVYLLTVLMCTVSGALAMRKLRSADPAEIF